MDKTILDDFKKISGLVNEERSNLNVFLREVCKKYGFSPVAINHKFGQESSYRDGYKEMFELARHNVIIAVQLLNVWGGEDSGKWYTILVKPDDHDYKKTAFVEKDGIKSVEAKFSDNPSYKEIMGLVKEILTWMKLNKVKSYNEVIVASDKRRDKEEEKRKKEREKVINQISPETHVIHVDKSIPGEVYYSVSRNDGKEDKIYIGDVSIEELEKAFGENWKNKIEVLESVNEAKLSGKYKCKTCGKPITKWDFDKNRQTCFGCNDVGNTSANQAHKYFNQIEKQKRNESLKKPIKRYIEAMSDDAIDDAISDIWTYSNIDQPTARQIAEIFMDQSITDMTIEDLTKLVEEFMDSWVKNMPSQFKKVGDKYISVDESVNESYEFSISDRVFYGNDVMVIREIDWEDRTAYIIAPHMQDSGHGKWVSLDKLRRVRQRKNKSVDEDSISESHVDTSLISKSKDGKYFVTLEIYYSGGHHTANIYAYKHIDSYVSTNTELERWFAGEAHQETKENIKASGGKLMGEVSRDEIIAKYNELKKKYGATEEINNLRESISEDEAVLDTEPLEKGDEIIYKDQFMKVGLKGVIDNVLDNNMYEITYYTLKGRKEVAKKHADDIELATPEAKQAAKEVNKVKKMTDNLGKVGLIMHANGPRDWDNYIGKYGRIEGELENTYVMGILDGDDVAVYVPKQYVQIQESNEYIFDDFKKLSGLKG